MSGFPYEGLAATTNCSVHAIGAAGGILLRDDWLRCST